MRKLNLFLTIVSLLFSCSSGSNDIPINDKDFDGIADTIDNCPSIANANQANADNNGIGDLCEIDGGQINETGQIIVTSLKSNIVFDEYNYPVQIYLPKIYNTNKNLPIIYLLDGKFNFDRVTNLVKSTNIDAIVVGVGDFVAKKKWKRRWVDLLPESGCHETGGRNLDFYAFITKELVPFIDSKYDNDHTSRSLIGHSSAGLFTFISMFLEDPNNVIFHNFIASDPELGCDRLYFHKMLQKDYDFSSLDKKFNLYLALSSDGDIDAVRHFSEVIKAKEYSWLTFKYEEFLSETHFGIIVPSFSSGLLFISDNQQNILIQLI